MTTLEQLIQQGIDEHRAPCVAISARKHDREIRLVAGRHTYHPQAPRLQEQDLFDLASLTKVVATTSLLLLRIQQGTLELDQTIQRYLPQRQLPNEQQPTIRQLMTHCAGLPPFRPFHKEYGDIQDHQQQNRIILNTPCQAPLQTQAVYSDIGFMILGILLEELDPSHRTLDLQFQQDIAAPLGLTHTLFCPKQHQIPHCVPTELKPDTDTPWQGIVHDENARWRHGVSGHAGLFSTIDDMATFADIFRRNRGDFFDPKLISLATTPAHLIPSSSRCLGWDAHSPLNPVTGQRDTCFAPDLLSPRTFGHTGFTGTSCWIDPDHDTSVIILTNAVHPHREDKEAYFPWRNQLHAQALRELNS